MHKELRRYFSHKSMRSKNKLNKIYRIKNIRVEHKTSEDIGKVREDLSKREYFFQWEF